MDGISYLLDFWYICYEFMNIEDVKYLASNIGNLSGIPVRLYKNREKIFYYSIINLPVDPILLHEERIFEAKEHVSYIMDSFFYYYGIISFGNYKLVVGPSRQISISDQEVKEFAFINKVNADYLEEFTNGMKAIINMPLASILQMLCITNFVLNEGEKISLKDIQIYDAEQEILMKKLEREKTDDTVQNIEGDNKIQHNTYNIEQTIMNYVRKGEVQSLKDYFNKMPAVRSGITSSDYIRQMINMFIVSTTLASRASIRGGLDVEEALSLSDAYIQKCELEKSVESIMNLQYRMIIDYAERVEKLKFGGVTSKLVSDVMNYIRHHLSETITTEDIAKSLYMSRSYLSVKFKEETGENLARFITKNKIDEAKRLLRYSDQPLTSIALYLGFSSQSHFSRVFKIYTSITPNEYREQHK